MSIRKKIAAWLDPVTAKEAARHWYLRLKLEEAAMYLGSEFPAVDATIRWAKVAEYNHFRGLYEKGSEAVPGKPWIHDIRDFREHLRNPSEVTP